MFCNDKEFGLESLAILALATVPTTKTGASAQTANQRGAVQLVYFSTRVVESNRHAKYLIVVLPAESQN